jgi:hypothetical protein
MGSGLAHAQQLSVGLYGLLPERLVPGASVTLNIERTLAER